MRKTKLLMLLGVIMGVVVISIPVGLSYAKEFTMFGNTFDENSECAEYGLKWFEAKNEKPYNLDVVQPQMMIAEKRCNPDAP